MPTLFIVAVLDQQEGTVTQFVHLYSSVETVVTAIVDNECEGFDPESEDFEAEVANHSEHVREQIAEYVTEGVLDEPGSSVDVFVDDYTYTITRLMSLAR